MHLSANIKGNRYLDAVRLSKTHLFHVKMFDSIRSFSANQKDVKIQILTQAPPTFNNGIN